MLGVKGYCCKYGPFRLLRSDLEKKKFFCVVHASKSLTHGKDTNELYTWRKLLTEFQRTSCYISLLYQFRKQIPVHDSTYNTSANVSRGTKKKKGHFCHR